VIGSIFFSLFNIILPTKLTTVKNLFAQGSENLKTHAQEGWDKCFSSFIFFSLSVPPPSEKNALGFPAGGQEGRGLGEEIFARPLLLGGGCASPQAGRGSKQTARKIPNV
jgi:hypothetical protein